MKRLMLAMVMALFSASAAQAYQVLPDPFAPFSTDQSIFYWSGNTGPIEGITDAPFSGPAAPGLGDTEWIVNAPAGGIILDFVQVFSPITGSQYELYHNGNLVPWSLVDFDLYSYHNLFNYGLTQGQHTFTVQVIDSSGAYCCNEGPLGDGGYNWSFITFNSDPGVAPAVPLPPGLVLLGGLVAFGGWRMRRRSLA